MPLPPASPRSSGTEATTENLVLASGQRRPHKNWDRLIRALALVEDDVRPRLVITGGSGEDPLAPVVAETGMERVGRAARLGRRRRARRPAQRRARAMAFPTLAEGFGLPVLEAMSRAFPCSPPTSPCCGRSAATPPCGSTRWTSSPSPTRCASAATRPEVLSGLAAAGLERARLFSWERVARETVEVFHLALADRR